MYISPIIKLLPLTKTAWSQLGIPLKTSQIWTTNDTGYFLIAAIKIKGMSNWGVRKSWPTPQNCTTVQLPWIKHLYCYIIHDKTLVQSICGGPTNHDYNCYVIVFDMRLCSIDLPQLLLHCRHSSSIAQSDKYFIANEKTKYCGTKTKTILEWTEVLRLHFLLFLDHNICVIQNWF